MFMLGAQSTLWENNDAEDSADQWATFSRLRLLTLVYPELDFMRSWKVQRDVLLHHCSIFDCLRHPDAGSIKDLAEHDCTKDPFYDCGGLNRNEVLRTLVLLVKENCSNELNGHIKNANRKYRKSG